jgi:hypothetical protein
MTDEDMVVLKDGKNPLLPCPFCGGAAWMTGLWEGGKAIVCMKCKAQGPPSEYQPQVAFDGWNRRTTK